MDQLHQWFVWKQFAIQAINANVDKDSWTKILPMLQARVIEMYQQVYPGRDPGAGGGRSVDHERGESI